MEIRHCPHIADVTKVCEDDLPEICVIIKPVVRPLLSNPLAKPVAIAEYSPISPEQTALCIGETPN